MSEEQKDDENKYPLGTDYLAGYIDNEEEKITTSIWKKIKSLFK